MKRPSKQEIKAALDQMRGTGPESTKPPENNPSIGAVGAKKQNKNRIRKQGV